MSVFQVDSDGELVRLGNGFERVGGITAIAQDLRVTLRLRRGEIPTRTDIGVPWTQLLAAGVDTVLLAEVLGRDIVATRPGIVSQTTTVSVDGPTRVATIEIQAIGDVPQQQRQIALESTISVVI